MFKRYSSNSMMSTSASTSDVCFAVSVCLIMMGTISLVSIIFSIIGLIGLLLSILVVLLLTNGENSRKRTAAVNA